jgi:hypothetical protein
MGKMIWVFVIGVALCLGAVIIPVMIFPLCMSCGIISFEPTISYRTLLTGLMVGAGIAAMTIEVVYGE